MTNTNKLLPSLVLASAGVFSSFQAAASFSNDSVAGVWVFSGDGTLVSTAEPVAMVGLISFNAQGQCAIGTDINVGGVAYSTTTSTCSFSINPGGRGSLTFQLAPEIPLPELTFALAVVDDDDDEGIKAIGTGDLVVKVDIKEQDDDDDLDDVDS